MTWKDILHLSLRLKSECLGGYGFIESQKNKKKDHSKIYIVNSKYIDSYKTSRSFDKLHLFWLST